MRWYPLARIAVVAALSGCDNENDLGSGMSHGGTSPRDAGLDATASSGGSGGQSVAAGGSSGAGGGSGAAAAGRGADDGAAGSGGASVGDASTGRDAGRRTCEYPFVDVLSPICGPNQCGNGQLDSCRTLCTSPGPCPTVNEDCDPAVPAGTTCEARGYVSGRITCTDWCSFDETACFACVAPAGSLLSCERPCVDSSNATSVAVAVTSDTIGVAWTTWCSTCGNASNLHFAGLDARLQVLFEAPSPGRASLPAPALVRSSTGWLLAATDDSGVTIYRFDDRGRLLGTRGIAGGREPAFGAQPGGPPLLLFTRPSADPSENGFRQAAMLTDDGQMASTAVDLWPSPEATPGVLFVGDGFLVAQRGGTAIHVAHVSLSGALLGSAPMPFGDYTEGPALVPMGQGIGVTYLDYSASGAIMWAMLDKTGAVVSAPVPVSPQPNTYNPTVYALTANDANAFVLAPSPGPHFELGLAALDPKGRLSTSPFVIAKSGNGFQEPVLTRFGTNALAAWIEGPMGGSSRSAVGTLYLGLLALH
jgi:hypothetical protein